MSDFASELAAAQKTFAEFLEKIPRDARLTAMHDSDADGVTAGVLWQRGLERLKYSLPTRVIPDRMRNAWTIENRALAAAAHPEYFFLMDLGSQPHRVVENAPHCFIDHHKPEGFPEGDVLISAYNWNPIPNTSWLLWELLQPLVEMEDLDWIAVVGTISDLGEKAPFDLIEIAGKKYTKKYLKEATTLVNAIRRSSNYNPEAAARALLNHENPKDLVLSNSSEVLELKAAREEVKIALGEAKKAAPVFAGKVALIRINTPCQVHPLIAQIWRTRLPKFIVIAANEGYIKNRVNFSARASGEDNALQFLRSQKISDGEGSFGHGHDQASGGSLEVARWNELLKVMGFSSEVFAE